jgi:hypothetical protein
VGWEIRERGGSYYVRSRRVGGRVVREYVGGGLAGRLASESDRIARARREARALEERREREKLEALAAPVLELSEAAEILVRAELLACGYHKHKGVWRRERST